MSQQLQDMIYHEISYFSYRNTRFCGLKTSPNLFVGSADAPGDATRRSSTQAGTSCVAGKIKMADLADLDGLGMVKRCS